MPRCRIPHDGRGLGFVSARAGPACRRGSRFARPSARPTPEDPDQHRRIHGAFRPRSPCAPRGGRTRRRGRPPLRTRGRRAGGFIGSALGSSRTVRAGSSFRRRPRPRSASGPPRSPLVRVLPHEPGRPGLRLDRGRRRSSGRARGGVTARRDAAVAGDRLSRLGRDDGSRANRQGSGFGSRTAGARTRARDDVQRARVDRESRRRARKRRTIGSRARASSPIASRASRRRSRRRRRSALAW